MKSIDNSNNIAPSPFRERVGVRIPDKDIVHWYVIRCHNMVFTKLRALLDSEGAEYFVPEAYGIVVEKGKKVKRLLPVVKDFLFIRATYNDLLRKINDEGVPMFFYYSRTTHVQNDAIWVSDIEMQRFMRAAGIYDRNPEIRPFGEIEFKKGDYIRIVEGPLEGVEGWLVQIRKGQRKKLVITLSNLMTVTLPISPEDLIEKVEE